ncbi:MAG: trypsin-like peptidase domain-containing protein [Chromatiales bacterium]|jgi:serine protease DegS
MKIQRLLTFILTSTVAGLAAAFVVLLLFPDLLQEEKLHVHEAAQPVAVSPATGVVSYADAVSRAAPSVVNIFTTKITTQQIKPLFKDPFVQQFFGDSLVQTRKHLENSLGSGVIIDKKGYILTNNHVIDGADQIRIVLASGQTLHAELIGADADTDLAVLKTDHGNLPAISFARSEHIHVGDVVLAIGNPFGVGQTVTQGIVSATGRSHLGINTFENFIQTDAAINPGNSGGALINAHGDLIGISTAIFSKTGGSQGIGFAIPADLARGVMQQIVATGRVVRGWLGIAGQDVTPQLAEAYGLKQEQGILISGVQENGPADQAGLQPGDIITNVDNAAPKSAFEILNLIAVRKPGSQVIINGWRGSQKLEITATIQERPANAALR